MHDRMAIFSYMTRSSTMYSFTIGKLIYIATDIVENSSNYDLFI